jgi:hypothetical protein
MPRSTPSRISKTGRKKNKRVRKTNGRNNLEPKVSKGRDLVGLLEDDVQEMLRDDAVVLEPRSDFNNCIVGVTSTGVLVYSVQQCIEVFMSQGMTDEEASEFFQYNTLRAMDYVKEESRPIFLFAERPPQG